MIWVTNVHFLPKAIGFILPLFILSFFLQLRVRREQASSSFAETEMEKGAHRQTKEALDLSEKTVS